MSIKQGTNRFFPRAEPPMGATEHGSVVEGIFDCPGTVAVGDAVALSGANTVDKANAADPTRRPAIGYVASKPTATTCVVVSYGELTVFGGLVAGRIYYLSDAVPGGSTITAPSASGSTVQRISVATDASTQLAMFDLNDTLLA